MVCFRLSQWLDHNCQFRLLIVFQIGDLAGSSVSLNSEGNCVAVGAEGHDDYYVDDLNSDDGQARILCCLGR